jgi:hypothetical protein
MVLNLNTLLKLNSFVQLILYFCIVIGLLLTTYQLKPRSIKDLCLSQNGYMFENFENREVRCYLPKK